MSHDVTPIKKENFLYDHSSSSPWKVAHRVSRHAIANSCKSDDCCAAGDLKEQVKMRSRFGDFALEARVF
jgi:hypothetical protein